MYDPPSCTIEERSEFDVLLEITEIGPSDNIINFRAYAREVGIDAVGVNHFRSV